MSVVAVTHGGMTEDEIIRGIREQGGAGELPAPAAPAAVAELEAVVGYPMPPLLKRVHLEVADGGFGRWGEALPLTETDYRFSDSPRMVETYLGRRSSPGWPPAVVPSAGAARSVLPGLLSRGAHVTP